ncbi:MAG: hypothetical protein A2020_16440 [Lentisphaerae bacterium GWF2_45_14]|nr:MAG: hypothetical protein A2020_16440 [Lentisphaerae bacterium GWF2_45_14]
MANLNKSEIVRLTGLSRETIRLRWADMVAAVKPLTKAGALEWFAANIRCHNKTVKASKVEGKKEPSSGNARKKAGSAAVKRDRSILGDNYPSAFNAVEAELITRVEKNKCAIATYQKKIIERYKGTLLDELVQITNEIRNFLIEECQITQEQSIRFNQLTSRLEETLKD